MTEHKVNNLTTKLYVMKLPKDLQFITSPRFWAVVIGSVAVYLEQVGYIGEAERNLIATVVAGFVTIKSVDRFSEKVGGK